MGKKDKNNLGEENLSLGEGAEAAFICFAQQFLASKVLAQIN